MFVAKAAGSGLFREVSGHSVSHPLLHAPLVAVHVVGDCTYTTGGTTTNWVTYTGCHKESDIGEEVRRTAGVPFEMRDRSCELS